MVAHYSFSQINTLFLALTHCPIYFRLIQKMLQVRVMWGLWMNQGVAHQMTVSTLWPLFKTEWEIYYNNAFIQWKMFPFCSRIIFILLNRIVFLLQPPFFIFFSFSSCLDVKWTQPSVSNEQHSSKSLPFDQRKYIVAWFALSLPTVI